MNNILDSPYQIYSDKFALNKTPQLTVKVNNSRVNTITLPVLTVDLNIYKIPDSTFIIICSDNDTNFSSELIATELLNISPSPWGEKISNKLLFIEHYQDEFEEHKFNLVQFNYNQIYNTFDSPRYSRLSGSCVTNLINPTDFYEYEYENF